MREEALRLHLKILLLSVDYYLSHPANFTRTFQSFIGLFNSWTELFLEGELPLLLLFDLSGHEQYFSHLLVFHLLPLPVLIIITLD